MRGERGEDERGEGERERGRYSRFKATVVENQFLDGPRSIYYKGNLF